MKNKKLMALPLIAIIAIGMTGVAYAAWHDEVHIIGKVKMGTLTFAFDDVEPPIYSEFHKRPGITQLQPGEYMGKNISWGRAWFSDLIHDEHSDKDGYKKLNIEIFNAYPQLYGYTTFKFHNIGTIPLNVCQYNISGEKISSVTGATVCDLVFYDPDGDYIGELFEDYDGDGVQDSDENIVINLEITNALPYQIDNCSTHKAEIDLHFKQEAQECHIYKIEVLIWGIQWNKDCVTYLWD
jgi:hypothetical protein